MNYQLRRNQTLGANLRRICRKQVEGALEIVRGEREANDTPVHETRKHLKKARAALQMVSDEIGRAALQKAGPLFSRYRPADFGRARRGGALANGAAITGDHAAHFAADIPQNRGAASGGTGTFHGSICGLAKTGGAAVGEVAGRD